MLESRMRPAAPVRALWTVPLLVAALVVIALVVAALRPPAATGASLPNGGAGAAGITALSPGVRAALAAAAGSPASSDGPLGATVDVSPFFPNHDGVRDSTSITVVLSAPATLDVAVMSFDGARIVKLATAVSQPAGTSVWAWDGTNANKAIVPDGAYFFRVTATTASSTFHVSAWVTKDKLVPYPADPRSIVVALDAGHGKPDPGAYYNKLRESNMNLDIALRLQHMLEASGIQVVMTRTTDSAINIPEVDVSGDGKITHDDELVARNDVANLSRADLHIVLMNNAYGCHCAQGTETYTSGERSWTPEGVDLARAVQAAHMARLKPFRTAAWQPNDRGVKLWHYAAVRPYNKKEMPRPSFMPSVLVESLFMDHPNELRVLSKPAARAALATAYFDGIAKWLAKRSYGLRYDVTSAPATAVDGSTIDYAMQLTNRGNQPSSGWILEARMVPAVAGQPYDGTTNRGKLVAETPVPDGLAPGHAVDISLAHVPVPLTSGNWLVKFDVRLPGSAGSLQDQGVVGPQLSLTSTDVPPPPTPTPTLSPSDSPTTSPTGAPTALPSASPTDAPLPSPSEGASPSDVPASPSAEPSASVDPGSGTTLGLAGSQRGPSILFGRLLPHDPDLGRPSVAAAFKWGLFQVWRRYITPIDIPPDSAMGQQGLDEHGD